MLENISRLRGIEAKWQSRWSEADIHNARADPSRPKYFLNVPYPYMNGYLHIGFGVTFLHADIMARFKRMQGYNVLFPQAFHCTGMPVLAAANLVKEGNPAQIKILLDMGIQESMIPSFSEIIEWTRFFPEAAKTDLMQYGASIDWTRTFITTELNPAYDRFVKWQFRRLLDKGYVKTGKHPVIWCPKDGQPVADHDRYEGEGETPVEYTLLKFPWRGKFLIAATLRPETVFGQTNLWVDPEVKYEEAEVDGETWILSQSALDKLREQDRRIKILGDVSGSDMVGQKCEAPMIHRSIPILPTRFIDQTKGTGIVTSVPSDAPDDWIALKVLRQDKEYAGRYGIDFDELEEIKPIEIIRTEGWGPLPAVEICDKMGIDTLDDREKLEKAKEEVYASGFYRGVMNDNCGTYSGMKVAQAKDEIREEMVGKGEASSMWEASGEVVCRCRTPAIVKIVSDQWFLAYGNGDWKAETVDALDGLKLHPDISRKQFEHVLQWLNDWPCTHHTGLGTRLPWDERWVIESLSDSTIYMAYYTIAHITQESKFKVAQLTDEVFDYVFLGEGSAHEVSANTGIAVDVVEQMRREFEYWYPFDLRHSGKDLIQNHLSFCLFNHTAIFPKKHWPQSFGINGFVKVGATRMSKSHGVATYLRDVLRERGADVVRLTLAQGGEGLDDPGYDDNFAVSASRKLLGLLNFAVSKQETRADWISVDSWFKSVLHRTIDLTLKAMEGMWHRTAVKHCYFDLQRHWNWYLRRCGSVPNAQLLAEFIRVQTKLLAPFTPHLAEEIWEATGNEGFVCLSPYPDSERDAINPSAEANEEYIERLLDDVGEIIKVTGLEPERITIYVAPDWKKQAYEATGDSCMSGEPDLKSLMQQILGEPEMKKRAKEVATFVGQVLENLRKMSHDELEIRRSMLDELGLLNEAKTFIESEFGCEVLIQKAETSGIHDPKKRADHAVPWKPAIYIE